jgi:hypothetical protein
MTFPIPHARTKQESYIEYETVTTTDLVSNLDCSNTLQDDYTLHEDWTDMPNEAKIVVDIESSEYVNVKLTDGHGGVFYTKNKKVHSATFIRSKKFSKYGMASYTYDPEGTDANFDISITNFQGYGQGDSADMSGSIKVYRVYETQEEVTKYRTIPYAQWLPWWMP